MRSCSASQRSSSSATTECGRTPKRGGKPCFLRSSSRCAHLDIDIVRVAPFLLILSTLLPEATFIEAFAVCQFFRKIGIHVASDLFDLANGTLHRLLVDKGKFFHLAQEGDDVVHALIQEEKTFINTQLRECAEGCLRNGEPILSFLAIVASYQVMVVRGASVFKHECAPLSLRFQALTLVRVECS